MESAKLIISFLAALGTGLMAGLFFVFSNTIMTSLERLPPAEGMAAMRSINTTIVNPLFLFIFLGTGLLCAVLIVMSLVRFGSAGSGFLLAGAAAYLLGSILVTMVFNVPMNDALMAAKIDDPSSISVWQDYLSRWTMWNHVRTIGCVISAAAFTAFFWIRQQ